MNCWKCPRCGALSNSGDCSGGCAELCEHVGAAEETIAPLDAGVPIVCAVDLVDEALTTVLNGQSIATLLDEIRAELASGDD